MALWKRGEHTPFLRGYAGLAVEIVRWRTTLVVDGTEKIIVSAFSVPFGLHKYLRPQERFVDNRA